MTQPFEPSNDLERALVAAQQNQLPVTAFLQTLRASPVYVLLDRPPGTGGVWDQGATPMVLSNPEKTPFLAVFTAPERASAWTQRQTSYSQGLSTDFAKVLQGMAPHLGIVINPGHAAGFDIPPATVAQLRAQAK